MKNITIKAASKLVDATEIVFNDIGEVAKYLGIPRQEARAYLHYGQLPDGRLMTDGTKYEHSVLSASNAHRWMVCPASVRMEEGKGEGRSDFRDEGSVAHALADLCLSSLSNMESVNIYPDDYVGKTLNGYPDHPVDIEMAGHVQGYINSLSAYPGTSMIEQRVSFSEWVPGGAGPADLVVFDYDDEGMVTVIDFKYGKGIPVDVRDNPQLKLYALGVFNEYGHLYDIDTFKLVVHQPRLNNISEWTLRLKDLLAWADTEVSEKARIALQDDAPFNPGKSQCRFCKAKPVCRAYAQHSIDLVAQEDFAHIDQPVQLKNIETLDNTEIAAILPDLDAVTQWVNSLKKYAREELEAGRTVPGHKLVHGRSIRKWKDAEAAEKALRRELKAARTYQPRKIISPAAAEEILGEDHRIMQQHAHKPPGKPICVPESDKRASIAVNPEEEFADVDSQETPPATLDEAA